MSLQAAFVNRVLAGIRSDLNFLLEAGVIDEKKRSEIEERIPGSYRAPTETVNSTTAASVSNAPSAAAVSSPVPVPQSPSVQTAHDPSVLGMAEAIYEFNSPDPGDLSIRPGERVQITEFCNQDWLRGRNQYGKEGIFPRSYCKLLEQYRPPGQGMPMAPPYNPAYPNEKVSYYPGGAPGPNLGPRAGPSPAPAPAQVAQQQPDNRFSNTAHKIGGKIGNSFLFGVGASAGANVVNAIM